MDPNNTRTVSISPHIRDNVSIPKIMVSVIGALCPAWIAGIYFFGPRAAWLTLLSIAAAVGMEYGIQKLRKVPISISDGSAVLTGMLLAFNIPPGVSWWIPVVGSAFAIGIGKQVFGGLGYNPMNPALLGRAFLLASWPVQMTTRWLVPRGGTLSGLDGITSATPLTLLKQANKIPDLLSSSYADLFWGRVGGCLGETSVIMLLIGAAYLIYKGYVDWRMPTGYLGVVIVLSWLFGGASPLFHLLAGGLILGAFFMAPDMVTSPITPRGRWIFGIGCGILTVVIRRVGGYPEGVSYSILLMNLTVPLIDRYTRPKIFGG
ncbi:MAG: RnfABCDGE type electron transport complex subunit D [Candidatus Latescibacterota bacterium]